MNTNTNTGELSSHFSMDQSALDSKGRAQDILDEVLDLLVELGNLSNVTAHADATLQTIVHESSAMYYRKMYPS